MLAPYSAAKSLTFTFVVCMVVLVLTCYKLDISFEQFISWYDFCLSNQAVNISLAKYILSPQERREAEEKHLTELKERVEMAEKEFQKALDEYSNK